MSSRRSLRSKLGGGSYDVNEENDNGGVSEGDRDEVGDGE